jgi:hypothetical protein
MLSLFVEFTLSPFASLRVNSANGLRVNSAKYLRSLQVPHDPERTTTEILRPDNSGLRMTGAAGVAGTLFSHVGTRHGVRSPIPKNGGLRMTAAGRSPGQYAAWQDAEEPLRPVIRRSPPFLLADDEESRNSFVFRAGFLASLGKTVFTKVFQHGARNL